MNPYAEFEMRAYLLWQDWGNKNSTVFNAWKRIYCLWSEWESENGEFGD